jgi:hypothetical protein
LRVISSISAAILAAVCCAVRAADAPIGPFLHTGVPEYDPAAELKGVNRFPVIPVSASGRQRIAPAFYASADPVVSFGGTQILFAGKASADSPWQIREAPAAGGTPWQLVHCQTDCTHPVSIPDGRIACTRASSAGSDVEIVDVKGGSPQRLTFAPGRYVTQDVLRDGRIPMETRGELYTVYPDGTGVESLRCDHGPHRTGARQLASGDVIFSVGGRLARFTPALASPTDVAQPQAESAGPIAEISQYRWLIALHKPIVGSDSIPGRIRLPRTITFLESIFRATTSGSQPPRASAMEFASRRKDNRNDNHGYTRTNRQR